MEFIKEVASFLNNYDGALMVIITFVYVVATCFICGANLKSAQASKEQLTVMKQEHEETIRFQIIPFLQIEETMEHGFQFGLDLPLANEENSDCSMNNIVRIKNIGNGAATNITYTWVSKLHDISIDEVFPVNAIKADGEYKLNLSFDCIENEVDSVTGTLILHFDDMRGYSYYQHVYFNFCKNRVYSGIYQLTSDVPIYTDIKENA